MPMSLARVRTAGVERAPTRVSSFGCEQIGSTFPGVSEDTKSASWESSTASLTRVSPTLHQIGFTAYNKHYLNVKII